MNVLIIGNSSDAARFNERFPQSKAISMASRTTESCEVAVWFRPWENALDPLPAGVHSVFIDCSRNALSDFRQEILLDRRLYGFISLSTFFERELFEVSCENREDKGELSKILENWLTEYEVVEDQVGMVSPRVIAMIINEAYHTAGEGTASREDIDIGMKLGTNYPKGPFEWAQEIGVDNVYRLMLAVYKSTGEKRYEPSPLLEKEGS